MMLVDSEDPARIAEVVSTVVPRLLRAKKR